jgi:hypothetical protein
MINPGTRPSRLTLARRATGETSGPDVSDVSTETSDVSRWLAALDAERARVEPFDYAAIRARAERLDETPTRRIPAPAPWWRRLLYLVPVLAIAAALLLVVAPPPTSPTNRVKGESDLGFYVLRDGQVYAGKAGDTFREGDRLRFTTRAAQDRLVLLSIDGAGHLTLFYPEAGEAGVLIVPGEVHKLDSSIELDDAPGPEVFVGFFGDAWSVSRARETAQRVYDEGGHVALEAFARGEPSVSALLLEKE